METAIKVLLVEDSESDANLVLRELEKGGYKVESSRVVDEKGLRQALALGGWDMVVCDFSLPSFDAMTALWLYQQTGQDAPFFVVSGSIGEETAVQVLKAGASDFVLKDRLFRFLPAVERELREAAHRRDKRQAEQALRASEQRAQMIVECSQEGILLMDAGGKVEFANAPFSAMLQLEPGEQVVGHNVLEWVDPELRPAIEARMERRRHGDRMPGRFDCLLRRKDGAAVWAVMNTAGRFDGQGRYLGSLVMVSDFTETRRLQEQLMVADRMASVGLLAAGVGHEINNPLAAALADLDAGLRKLDAVEAGGVCLPELAELRECVGDAVEACLRVRDIVRDLKVFARGTVDQRTAVDAVHVMESTLRLAFNEIHHRARVVRDYGAVPPVMANEARLGQIFLNLLMNAAQSIEEGRAETNHIRVACEAEAPGWVAVTVEDTGRGMTPEVRRRLFTPFFSTKGEAGTGLGLAICHRLVAALGGRIEVESTAGLGSSFKVWLPAAPTGLSAARVEAEAGEVENRRRVLVVDDEPLVVRAIQRTLAVEHDVEACGGGREALARLDAGERYDVVLCDLMMPSMAGWELFEEIEKRYPEMGQRMIFLTGGAFTERAMQFLESVENMRLEKPFDASSLKAAVRRQLGGANA